MRTSFIFSLALHIAILGFLQLWSLRPDYKIQKPNIYQIQLVNIPKIQRKIEATTEIKKSSEHIMTPTVTVKKEPKKEISDIKSQKVEKPLPAKVERDSLKNFGESNVNTNSAANASDNNIKIEIPDFPFAYYIALLQNRLQDNWRPPFQSSDSPIKRTVNMKFTILKNGMIMEIGVEKSSGYFLFDQAALRAVLAINPMPPLPVEFNGEYLVVHIEFE